MSRSRSSRHSAPGQYLGYSIQPVRMCFHLLKAPQDAHVSLEHLDDVAIHYPDGRILLEQTKSALKQNPLSDWSPELWKSIANWLGMLSSGQIEPDKYEYRLYVTPVHSGSWAKALNDATSLEAIKCLTDEIAQALAKKRKPPTCYSFLQSFLEASDADRMLVISRMRVESVHADPVEPIRELMRPWVDLELIDLLCSAIIGMAKEQADKLIREDQPAILSVDDFQRQARSFVQKHNLQAYLPSFSSPPPSEQIVSILKTRPNFIKQLELVEINEEQYIRAVSDFLRTSADKTAWAEAGIIYKQQLDEWDDTLIRQYEFANGELSDILGTSDPVRLGRRLFQKCGQFHAPLDGRAVPGHFVNGSYNTLADLLRIGWHPDYKTLIEREGK